MSIVMTIRLRNVRDKLEEAFDAAIEGQAFLLTKRW